MLVLSVGLDDKERHEALLLLAAAESDASTSGTE